MENEIKTHFVLKNLLCIVNTLRGVVLVYLSHDRSDILNHKYIGHRKGGEALQKHLDGISQRQEACKRRLLPK